MTDSSDLKKPEKKQSAAVERTPVRRVLQRVWWHLLHLCCLIYFKPMYRFRSWGVSNVPRRGAVMLVSNHQSHLDPIIVGLPLWKREFYAMARSTLFDHPFFGWLIRSLNAIAIDRGEADAAAIRRCIDVLKAEKALVVFAEGTRTEDGRTKDFQTGTLLLLRRSKAVVVPVALDGAFDAWPKGRGKPHATGRIGVMFGEPIPAADLLAMKSEDSLALLRDKVETMRLEVARRMGR
jgi:1-acyl-sn-glycerol-3-phosphate acyltransferase